MRATIFHPIRSVTCDGSRCPIPQLPKITTIMLEAKPATLLAGMRVCAFIAIAMSGSAASAQSPAEFYQGKTLDLYIGYTAGAGYDLYARLLARHLGKHVPGNPAVIPRNMDGAGSLRLANWLYNVASRDGTAIGMIGRGVAFDPMLARPGIQFEGTKFSWLGSITNEVSA